MVCRPKCNKNKKRSPFDWNMDDFVCVCAWNLFLFGQSVMLIVKYILSNLNL